MSSLFVRLFFRTARSGRIISVDLPGESLRGLPVDRFSSAASLVLTKTKPIDFERLLGSTGLYSAYPVA